MKDRITIELPKAVHQEFKAILDSESKSLSKQVRSFIIEYINTHNNTKKRIKDVYNIISSDA